MALMQQWLGVGRGVDARLGLLAVLKDFSAWRMIA